MECGNSKYIFPSISISFLAEERPGPGTRRPNGSPAPKCETSPHGCCPDEVTGALGPDHAGCPSVCQCNKLGSVAETCDPLTQECRCRPGVGGSKCDRCLPGFWGLPRIIVEGQKGCMSKCIVCFVYPGFKGSFVFVLISHFQPVAVPNLAQSEMTVSR